MNKMMKDRLKDLDPIVTLANDPRAVEASIDALNANGYCGYTVGDLRGLSSLWINELSANVDFQCGLAEFCFVCTRGKACGNQCMPKDAECSLRPGCAVNSSDLDTDVELHGRTVSADGTIVAYCRLCLQGKACGDRCESEDTTNCGTGCAVNPSDVVCKVCTGGRKNCGDSCVAADDVCTRGTGCARNAEDVEDVDLQKIGGASGRIAINSTEDISITAQGFCAADFCGKGVRQEDGACCEGEELHVGLCYKTCDRATSGTHKSRWAPCTCAMEENCKDNEEEHLKLCYKKCSLLTGGTHPNRSLTNTCSRHTRCQDDEEEHLGLCYKKCALLTDGSHTDRWLTNTCAMEDECAENEEKHLLLCHKKCSLLTGGTHPVRWAVNTCRKATHCDDNEETHLGLCYKKCSLLTDGAYPDRSATNTCTRSTRCRDDEEEHLGLCYKKCSLLTGGEYPHRMATNSCCSGSCGWLWNWWTKCIGCCGFGISGDGGCATIPYDPWTKGLGCNGYGISGDGGCAKPPYHVWTSGLGCNGFGVAGDGGCGKPLHHMWTKGLGCNGFGISVDGGCANIPYDPWTKGLGCNGFGVSGDGDSCAKIIHHPWTDCFDFGIAANGGLAHFQNVDPLTLTITVTLRGFRAAASFHTALNVADLKLSSLTISEFEVFWEAIIISIPELGIFNDLLQLLTRAISSLINKIFSDVIDLKLQQFLNQAIQEEVLPLINKKLDYNSIMQPIATKLNELGRDTSRRLDHRGMETGTQYTVLPNGSLCLKVPEVLRYHVAEERRLRLLAEAHKAEAKEERVLIDQTDASDIQWRLPFNFGVSPYTPAPLPNGYFSFTPAPPGAVMTKSVIEIQSDSSATPHWNQTVWATAQVLLSVQNVDYDALRKNVSLYLDVVSALARGSADAASVGKEFVSVTLSRGGGLRVSVYVGVAAEKQDEVIERVSTANGTVLALMIDQYMRKLDLDSVKQNTSGVVSTAAETLMTPLSTVVWITRSAPDVQETPPVTPPVDDGEGKQATSKTTPPVPASVTTTQAAPKCSPWATRVSARGTSACSRSSTTARSTSVVPLLATASCGAPRWSIRSTGTSQAAGASATRRATKCSPIRRSSRPSSPTGPAAPAPARPRPRQRRRRWRRDGSEP